MLGCVRKGNIWGGGACSDGGEAGNFGEGVAKAGRRLQVCAFTFRISALIFYVLGLQNSTGRYSVLDQIMSELGSLRKKVGIVSYSIRDIMPCMAPFRSPNSSGPSRTARPP